MPYPRPVPFLALIPVLALSSCMMMNVNVIETEEGKVYPEVAEEDVKVYKSSKSAPQPHKVIAELELSVAGDIGEDEEGTRTQKLIDRLVTEAASLGANGLIVGRVERPDGGRVAASILVGVPSESTLKAKAILFKPKKK